MVIPVARVRWGTRRRRWRGSQDRRRRVRVRRRRRCRSRSDRVHRDRQCGSRLPADRSRVCQPGLHPCHGACGRHRHPRPREAPSLVEPDCHRVPREPPLGQPILEPSRGQATRSHQCDPLGSHHAIGTAAVSDDLPGGWEHCHAITQFVYRGIEMAPGCARPRLNPRRATSKDRDLSGANTGPEVLEGHGFRLVGCVEVGRCGRLDLGDMLPGNGPQRCHERIHLVASEPSTWIADPGVPRRARQRAGP